MVSFPLVCITAILLCSFKLPSFFLFLATPRHPGYIRSHQCSKLDKTETSLLYSNLKKPDAHSTLPIPLSPSPVVRPPSSISLSLLSHRSSGVAASHQLFFVLSGLWSPGTQSISNPVYSQGQARQKLVPQLEHWTHTPTLSPPRRSQELGVFSYLFCIKWGKGSCEGKALVADLVN